MTTFKICVAVRVEGPDGAIHPELELSVEANDALSAAATLQTTLQALIAPTGFIPEPFGPTTPVNHE